MSLTRSERLSFRTRQRAACDRRDDQPEAAQGNWPDRIMPCQELLSLPIKNSLVPYGT